MRTSDVLAHYAKGDPEDPEVFRAAVKAIAADADVSPQAVTQWYEKGMELVPPLSAAILQERTRKKLKFDPFVYAGWNNRRIAS